MKLNQKGASYVSVSVPVIRWWLNLASCDASWCESARDIPFGYLSPLLYTSQKLAQSQQTQFSKHNDVSFTSSFPLIEQRVSIISLQ